MQGVVQRQVNVQLQQQLNASTSENSYLSTQSAYATAIDQMFGTPGSTNTLQSAISGLSSSLSTLQASPSDQSAQQGAVSAAQTVAQTLNQLSNSVQSQRTQAEGAIADGVSNVNTLTQSISDLNVKIVSGTAAGQDITNLEDQRDLDVTQLSSYVDVQTRLASTGSLSVFTTAGLELVGSSATQLSFNQAGVLTANAAYSSNPAASTVGTITSGTGSNTTDLIATGQIRSGSLAALINQRDVVLPQAQNQLDDLAASISQAFSDTKVAGVAASSGGQTGQSVDLTGIQNGNPVNLSYIDVSGNSQSVALVPVASSASLPLPQSVSTNPNVKVVGFVNPGGAGTAAAAATALQTALGTSFAVSNPSGNTLQVLSTGAGQAKVTGLNATVTQTQTQGGTAAFPLFTIGATGPVYTGAYGTRSQKTGLSSVLSVNSAVISTPSLLVNYSGTTQAGDPTRPTAMLTQYNNVQSTYGPETGIVSGTGAFTTTISGLANQMASYWGQVSQNATSALSSQQVIQNNLQSTYTSALTPSWRNSCKSSPLTPPTRAS
jgi:flagellar hook-associated protein 1 FlgK